MSLSLSRFVSALVAIACSGCMSAAVFDYRGDEPPEPASETLPVSLAINDLAFPQTRTTVSNPQAGQAESYGDIRFLALEERLNELLAESRLAQEVRRSRDLSRDGISVPGFVLQVAIRSYSSSSSEDPAGVAAAVIGAVFTAGLGAGGFVSAVTRRHEHLFDVEVRLHRVEDSELTSVRAAGSGELVAQYDTGGAELVWRATKQLRIESGHCIVCTPKGADADRWYRQEGRQMARIIFDEFGPELREQMQRSLAARPSTPVLQRVSTAGGESPAFEHTVRTRLDERASRILLCTDSDSAAVIVEWTEDGATTLQVRDAGDDVAGCVRAAVGDLSAPAGTPPGRVLHVVAR